MLRQKPHQLGHILALNSSECALQSVEVLANLQKTAGKLPLNRLWFGVVD